MSPPNNNEKTMEISFRPCRADDVELAVPLIYSSGPEAFRYVFSQHRREQALDFLRMAFQSGRGEFGYHRHIAVMRHQHLIGTGALLQHRQRLQDFSAVVTQMISFYRLNCWRVMWRGIIAEKVIQPPKKHVGFIANLGIAPECRGQGIGTLLIAHLLQLSREAGYCVAGLVVAATNPQAQKLYEALGFVVKQQRHSSARAAFGELCDHDYMENKLGELPPRDDLKNM